MATRAAGCAWPKEEGLGERMGKAVGVNRGGLKHQAEEFD